MEDSAVARTLGVAHQSAADSGYRTKPLLNYVTRTIAREDAVLKSIRESTVAKGLHTIEYDPKHAKVAVENIAMAGLASKVVVHVGAGATVLPELEKHGLFDLAFIDADKTGSVAPMRAALKLLSDETLFSSCAMIPTGEGMAVAVRR